MYVCMYVCMYVYMVVYFKDMIASYQPIVYSTTKLISQLLICVRQTKAVLCLLYILIQLICVLFFAVHILIAVLHTLTVPRIAAFCSRWTIISMLFLWGNGFCRFLSRVFGIAPIAPKDITNMLNEYPFYRLCIFVTRSIYFNCFSLIAFSRFVSSGTVTSTILQVISFLSQITMCGLFFSTFGVVLIIISNQIS